MQARVPDQNMAGGEGGIRTPDTRKGMADFESAAFNRALPPLRFGKPLSANGFCGNTSGCPIVSIHHAAKCEANLPPPFTIQNAAYPHDSMLYFP